LKAQNPREPATQSHGTLAVRRVAGRVATRSSTASGVAMQDPNPSGDGPDRDARRCPSCSTPLDLTGTGGDELLECPQCGLVMFDAPRR
jgi:hypothetical protein